MAGRQGSIRIKIALAVNRKVNVSLPADLLAYAETYRQAQGLASLGDVLVRALGALREAELAEGYWALAAEYAARPDPLAEAIGIGSEGLEPSDETSW